MSGEDCLQNAVISGAGLVLSAGYCRRHAPFLNFGKFDTKQWDGHVDDLDALSRAIYERATADMSRWGEPSEGKLMPTVMWIDDQITAGQRRAGRAALPEASRASPSTLTPPPQFKKEACSPARDTRPASAHAPMPNAPCADCIVRDCGNSGPPIADPDPKAFVAKSRGAPGMPLWYTLAVYMPTLLSGFAVKHVVHHGLVGAEARGLPPMGHCRAPSLHAHQPPSARHPPPSAHSNRVPLR